MVYHKLSLRALALSCFLLAHADLTLAVQIYNNSVPKEDKETVANVRAFITNYQLPDGPVKAGRRWGQRHPQGANLGSNGILKFLSKLKQSAATSPP